jgi:hypothetical protein
MTARVHQVLGQGIAGAAKRNRIDVEQISAASALTIGWPTRQPSRSIRSPMEIASVRTVSCATAYISRRQKFLCFVHDEQDHGVDVGRPHSPSVSAVHATLPPTPYESDAPSSRASEPRRTAQPHTTPSRPSSLRRLRPCARQAPQVLVRHRRGTHLVERVQDCGSYNRASPRIDDLERLANRQRSAVGAVGGEPRQSSPPPQEFARRSECHRLSTRQGSRCHPNSRDGGERSGPRVREVDFRKDLGNRCGRAISCARTPPA